MRILGIDPGSRNLGYAVIETGANRSQPKVLEHGTLRLMTAEISKLTPDESMPLRLREIFRALSEIIETHQPKALSVERAFFAKNVNSAMKLGQVRGVILVVGALQGMTVHEYSATEVKRAITGHGGAEKESVAKILQMLLGQQDFQSADASDALALAVAHSLLGDSPLVAGHPGKGSAAGRRSTKRGSMAEAVAHRAPKR
jgi:crossover junction endodeoxyribonuclease RuvC